MLSDNPDHLSGIPDFEAGPYEDLDFFFHYPVKMQRLDLTRSWASGNKFYKLKNYISIAISNRITTLVSKGGMFSNHLDAFVSACNTFGLQCKCIIRSYGPDENNPSTKRWISQHAELIYFEPTVYNSFDEQASADMFPNALFIPEGGGGRNGIEGAATMLHDLDSGDVTHIVIAGGSMTTALGLLSVLPAHIRLVIVPAWKNCSEDYIHELLAKYHIKPACHFDVWNEYHFGGFGRYNSTLVEFMQAFTNATNIPLDPVYTGKMMYAVEDKLRSGYFKTTDRILAIHTGGLQGVEGFAYRDAGQWASYAELIKKETG